MGLSMVLLRAVWNLRVLYRDNVNLDRGEVGRGVTQRASRQYLVWGADQGPLHDSMSLWYSVYKGSDRKPHKELYRDPLRRIHREG